MPAAESFIETPAPEGASNFVGRERELGELRTGLAAVASGQGRLFLLVGEPGIGKTRLASEVAAEAASAGALVLWGRCSEDVGVPPFWPWAQILRRLFAVDHGPSPSDDLLLQIVPEMRAGAKRIADASQPSAQRFELFDAVETRLRAVAARRSLVLILDDLHAADMSSLQLLQFLARQAHDAAILILGSYRPADLERAAVDGLQSALPDRSAVISLIARNGKRLPLAALSESDVASLVANAFGGAAPASLSASVYAVTEGHPLFVGEVVQLLLAERDASGRLPTVVPTQHLPQGVRAIINERLQPLSTACRRLLSEASVLGRQIDPSALRAVSTMAVTVQLDCLVEAQRAGILLAVAGVTGHFQFSHELIRDTLYGALPTLERAQLHRRIAVALEESTADPSASRVAEIAYHYAQTALYGDSDKAIDYSVRAAEQSVRQWAYEEADQYYAQALRGLDQGAHLDAWRHCEILLAQGHAQRAAAAASARATFEKAAAIARGLCADDAPRAVPYFAQAVLGLSDQGLGILQFTPDAAALQLLEEAARLLPATEARLQICVLARLAAHLSFPESEARSLAMIRDAQARARALGDAATLAIVLGQHHLILWRFNLIPGRIELASELIGLAEQLGDHDLAFQGRALRLLDRMTVGDAAEFDAELRTITERAEALRQPRYRWMATNNRAVRALWRGQWVEAETLVHESLQIAAEVGDPLALVGGGVQLFLLRRELGQESDEGQLRFVAQRFPDSPMPRALLLSLFLDRGDLAQARAEFEQLAIGDFAALRRDRRLGVLALLAEACCRLEDVERAHTLIELLEPFGDYNVMYSGNVCFGAAARYLGGLAALCGDWESATRRLQQAADRNRKMGAVVQLAWTAHDTADMWLRRAATSAATAASIEQASVKIEEARTVAAALSMQRLQLALNDVQRRLDALRPAEPDPPQPIGEATAATRQGIFRRDGDYWTVSDGHALARVQDSKGLHYIAELLRHPGREIHALDLSSSGAGAVVDVGRASDEPLLDARSRAAYRARLKDLRAEIDEAEGFNDVGRLQPLRHEEEQIKQELARAFGLRGRSRPAGSPLERARLNVTRAIKTAVRKIAAGDAGLGHYFSTTIKTGNLCAYAPDPRHAVEWSL